MIEKIIEKIDINKIRGHYQEWGKISGTEKEGIIAGGDDTIKSIQMVAEKVNEIIELLK